MKVKDIKTPVSAIAGIGPQLTKTLSKINIFTVGDLLQYYPRDYEDRSKKIFLRDFSVSPKVHTVARVVRQEWFGYGNMRNLKIVIEDGTAQAELICFNRKFLENTLIPGSIITVTGLFYVKYNSLQSTAFETAVMKKEELVYKEPAGKEEISQFERKGTEGEISAQVDLINSKPRNTGIIPVYSLTEGLTQKTLHKAIKTAIEQYAHGIENELPSNIIEQRKLLSKQQAIQLIHQPENMEMAKLARNTLVYEELFQFQTAVVERAFHHRGSVPGSEALSLETEKPENAFIKPEVFEESLSPLQKKFLESLPYKLTDDQRKVIYEMDADIDRGYEERNRIVLQLGRGIPAPMRPAFTMSRLLQGDVGSGKTLVSFFVCLRIISWKGQCAFMAPTEILARQHAENAARLLSSLGIRTAFLTGNLKAAGRNQLLKALKNGEIDIVIGTHAVFSSRVEYKDLQLVVIDEQHRFGVLQRQAIIEKGRVTEYGVTFEPHLLMMSATPIPQSLALTVFGDLDISTIKTLPEGRQPIQTYLVKEGNEINAYEEVRKELAKGHQAYFVYPAIDSDENIKSAERAFKNLSEKIYPQYKCALVHSKIEEEEQIKILEGFRNGSIQVLAATTVIEVGVDVPNATCMVIEQADRFGMAQLHQLRGRVGRGSNKSFCFLIYSKDITQTGIERVKALRQSTDGFYIAEQDLKNRGPGEINGTLQAGEMEFSIADMGRDQDIMLQARADVICCFNRKRNEYPFGK